MNIGIIGAGRIGGNCARFFGAAGHYVMVSFSRDASSLERLTADIGPSPSVGSPAEATAFGEVVVFSVPWGLIDQALAQTGSLAGKILIDTTNQFGPAGALDLPGGQTAAQFNVGRMPGARYTKSFNTLTSAFQAQTAGRTGEDRVVQWLCGDDEPAKKIVAGLIDEAGFALADVGGTADAAVMEAPRRPGAVYGEEYHLSDAEAVLVALRSGRPIPPTPSYD